MRDTGKRFELDLDGGTAFADYRRDAAAISILHVETPPELRGKGAAAKLMQEVANFAKSENIKIIPICSYAAAWLQRHSQ